MSRESIDKNLLQTFVPVNALTEDHLDRLLDHQEVRQYRAGDCLFEAGDEDNATVYLLSGRVALEEANGSSTTISAGDMESWHPLDHFQPRRVTARALSDVSVVRFDNFRLDAILSWDQSAGYVMADIQTNEAYRDDRDWMIKLLKSRLFYRVPPGNIVEIFRRLKPLRYREGEQIIEQGEDADCCYIIKDGMCEVTIRAEGASEPVTVALLEQGQWFGEEALLSGKPRNATVTMASAGSLMRLDRADFDELLREPVVRVLSADEARRYLDEGARWLDVRTPDEFEQTHFAGAVNMPLNKLRLKSRMLDSGRSYITCCDTGTRSASAAFLLHNAGLDVYVLQGGLNAEDGELRDLLSE